MYMLVCVCINIDHSYAYVSKFMGISRQQMNADPLDS